MGRRHVQILGRDCHLSALMQSRDPCKAKQIDSQNVNNQDTLAMY